MDKLQKFITENAWGIVTFFVMLIMAWTVLNTDVRQIAEDLEETRQVHAEDLEEIQTQQKEQDSVQQEILQRLAGIETKLDLLLEDRIKHPE